MDLGIDDENADLTSAVYIKKHLLSSIYSVQPSLLSYYQIESKFYFRDDWQEIEDLGTDKYVDFELVQIDYKTSKENTDMQTGVVKDECETENPSEDERLTTNTGSMSYAEKLKMNLQPPVTVTFQKKIFDVRFESWHTIIHSGLNEVYCMLCEQKMNKENMLCHCMFVYHLENLQKCEIIDSHEDCLIRKVNEKFGHCSKCNRLHFVYETRNHIRKAHGMLIIDNEQTGNAPKTTENEFLELKDEEFNKRTVSDSNNNDDLTVNPKINDKDASRHSANGNVTQTADLNVGNVIKIDNIDVNAIKDTSIIDKNNGIANVTNNKSKNRTYDNITKSKSSVSTFEHLEIGIFIFGCQLTLPVLSLNMISKPNDSIYYCGVCNLSFLRCYLNYHINLPNHKALLNTLYFLPEYSVNLIRYVREVFHCSLCNLPVSPLFILQHNLEPNHIKLLTLALTKQQAPSSNQSRTEPINKHIQTDKDLTTNTGIDSKEICANLDTKTPLKSTNNVCVSDEENIKHNMKSNAVNENLNDNGAAKINFEPEYMEFETNDRDAKKKGLSVFDDKVRIITTSARFDISAASLNIIVHNCDGNYYCGACDLILDTENTYKHIDNEGHQKNMAKYLFLEEYFGDHLIKQLSSKYHCATCNVLIKQTQLEHHLEWPLHKSLVLQCRLKKYRHRDKKNCVATQKKQCFLTKESSIKVMLRGKIVAATECQHLNSEQETILYDVKTAETEINVDSDPPTASPASKERRTSLDSNESHSDNLGGKELTFAFLNWHGIRELQSGGFKCIMCQVKFDGNIEEHVKTEEHGKTISNCNVVQRFLPVVIRRLDNGLAHCVLCNKQLSSADTFLSEHVKDSTHKKKLKKKLKTTKNAKTVDEVNSNVLIRDFLLTV